jgi:tRNA (guanine-N7-)-methyltransferase
MSTDTIVEKCGTSFYGKWLVKLRNGESPHFKPCNNYLFEAVELRELLYTRPELENEFPGIFPHSRPLILDVGCYFGHTTVEMAANNPDFDVLGLDVKYKRVVKTCRKIQQAQLPNAKVAMCDVREFLPLLENQSVYGVLIFFPDPWVKNRHRKYRFISEEFFNEIFPRLTNGGFLWIKTDHQEYHKTAVKIAGKCGFNPIEHLPPKISPSRYQTVFESIFLQQHIPIHQLILQK